MNFLIFSSLMLFFLIGGLNCAPASLRAPSRVSLDVLKVISFSFRYSLAKMIAGLIIENFALCFLVLSESMYFARDVSVIALMVPSAFEK